jgi:putative phosphoribosyl transferase
VPVGFEVARGLGATLEVFVSRKVGAPRQPELGIGAVAEGGTVVADGDALVALGIDRARFDALAEGTADEVRRRVERYRQGRPLPDLRDRDVVVVDDGLATGVTAEAALRDLRPRRPRRLVLAAPVCAADTARRLGALADGVVCVLSPDGFGAVGRWYECFDQTTDAEVLDLLARAGHRVAHRTSEPGQVRP